MLEVLHWDCRRIEGGLADCLFVVPGAILGGHIPEFEVMVSHHIPAAGSGRVPDQPTHRARISISV
jgi:hypothetical protein